MTRLDVIRYLARVVVVAPAPNRLRVPTRAPKPKQRQATKQRVNDPSKPPKTKAEHSADARARAALRGDCSRCTARKARPGMKTCEVCPATEIKRRKERRAERRAEAVEQVTEP